MINGNIYQSFFLLTFIVYVKFFWSCKLIFQRFFSNSCRSYDSNLKLLPLTDAFQRRCCSGGEWIRPLTCCNTICTASPDFVPAVFESVSSKTKRPDSFQVRYMDDCLDNRRTRQAISSVLSNNKWSWPFNAKRWGSLYRLQFLEQILFILNVSQLIHVWKHCVQHNLQESCECISYVYLSWNYIYPPPEELSHKVLALISFTSRHFFAKMRKGDPTLSHIKDVGCGQNINCQSWY